MLLVVVIQDAGTRTRYTADCRALSSAGQSANGGAAGSPDTDTLRGVYAAFVAHVSRSSSLPLPQVLRSRLMVALRCHGETAPRCSEEHSRG